MDARAQNRATLARERRSQLRGLLLLAAAVLLTLLFRARPLHVFHPNWWRL